MKIDLIDLVVAYPGFTLGPLTLQLSGGERIALVGPNGAGKSTVLRALCGLLPPRTFTGEVRLEDTPLARLLPEGRQQIGVLPENLAAFGWMTVAEHLEFLSRFYERWDPAYAAELLERLELPARAKVGTLSKGMRVKLAFISAEAYRPPVLLLDEPTSGIDPVMRGELLAAVRECTAPETRRLLVFSTHILEDIEEIADRILVLTGGKLVADAPTRELQAQNRGVPLPKILYNLLAAHEPTALRRVAGA